MAESKNIFRQFPPLSLVTEILGMLGLSKCPPFIFQRDEICLDQSIEIAALLEAYYIPCKAIQFLSYTDKKRWVTVLRHILKCHGWIITSKETTRDKKKAIIYSVERTTETINGPIQISFD
jgi:hypothetical protein